MKKILSIICAMMVCVISFAQNATNADGTIKHRANVAIMVTSNSFTFENGAFKKLINDELSMTLKSAFNAAAMQCFGNSDFGIVNRDDDAYANVKKILEEQKMEDYINGFSVQAKGDGADCLFLTDVTVYYKNGFCQIFISYRFMNIGTNVGFHYSMKTEPIDVANAMQVQARIGSMVKEFLDSLYDHILDIYPEQYAIAKSDGKKLYLSAYQPNGRILKSDKFYAFRYTQEILDLGQQKFPVTVLEPLSVATGAEPAMGYCLVKSNKALQPSNDIVLFRNQPQPMVSAGPMTWTYFPLTYKPNTYEGFIMNRVNNAVYDALTRHPGSIIIEQEHLSELKKERELQKTEDFIDGHVVEQMKAIGAQYLLHLDDFKLMGSQVKFTLKTVSVEQNKILRAVEVVTSIDNIENEMYKQICERMAYPCNILSYTMNDVCIISGWALEIGEEFIIQVNKAVENPISGEITYNRVPVCKCEVVEYKGNKSVAKIAEILSEEDFKLLPNYSRAGTATIYIDGTSIKTSTSKVSDLEKAAKRKSFLDALKNSISIQ